MRLLITTIIFTFHFTVSFGQSVRSQTEIIIIGIIHSGNKSFNEKTLYKILKKNKPDVILWEQSTKFKRVFALKTGNSLRIWKPGIEQLSLQKFSRLNRHIPILPFDTTFANKGSYAKNLSAIIQTFNDSLNNAKKSFADSLSYREFANKQNQYHNFIDTATLKRINQSDVVDIARQLNSLEGKVLIPLGIKYISDSLVVSNFRSEGQFWNERNEHMVNQIIKYSKQYAGKRIIVLSGLDHKYYLQDKLSDPKRNDIKIIEFAGD